jgi:hypothetical protein
LSLTAKMIFLSQWFQPSLVVTIVLGTLRGLESNVITEKKGDLAWLFRAVSILLESC